MAMPEGDVKTLVITWDEAPALDELLPEYEIPGLCEMFINPRWLFPPGLQTNLRFFVRPGNLREVSDIYGHVFQNRKKSRDNLVMIELQDDDDEDGDFPVRPDGYRRLLEHRQQNGYFDHGIYRHRSTVRNVAHFFDGRQFDRPRRNSR